VTLSPPRLTVVALGAGDIDAMLEVGYHGFLRRPPEQDEHRAMYRRFLAEAERIGVRDGDQLVGVAGVLPGALTVPGGAALPCSCVTWVAVLPTHRRRGALRSMMSTVLAGAQAAGRPLAGLWASESAIYGRFGFGGAAVATEVELDATRPPAWRVAPSGEPLRLVDRTAAAPLVAPIYDRLRRAGMLVRTDAWWETMVLDANAPWVAGDLTDARVVVLGEAGYAIYRTRARDEESHRDGVVEVQELVGQDAATQAALWDYLASIDLAGSVRAVNRPADDLLGLLLADPDLLDRRATYPSLWLRLVDVPAALEQRGWAADADLVLAVEDDLLEANAGAWRLTVAGGRARCAPAGPGAAPDLRLDVRDLGAAYLGGTPVAHLVAAGLAAERTAGAAAALDAAMHTPFAPFLCDEF
jgi:predicted acetyltransferase